MNLNPPKTTITDAVARSLTIGAVLSGLPLLGSSILTYFVIRYESVIAQFPAWSWLVITAVASLVCAVALLSPTPLALVFGYFLGWQGVLPIFVVNMAGIALVNVLVRRLDRNRWQSRLGQNPAVASLLHRIRANELRVIFFAKLSPVLPFTLTNIVFALSGARLRNVMLGGFLGMVPRTVLAVWTGHEAHAIQTLLANPDAGAVSRLVLAGLLLMSVAGLLSVFTRRFGGEPVAKPVGHLPDETGVANRK